MDQGCEAGRCLPLETRTNTSGKKACRNHHRQVLHHRKDFSLNTGHEGMAGGVKLLGGEGRNS